MKDSFPAPVFSSDWVDNREWESVEPGNGLFCLAGACWPAQALLDRSDLWVCLGGRVGRWTLER